MGRLLRHPPLPINATRWSNYPPGMSRDQAALALASCLGAAVVLLTLGLYIQAIRTGTGLNDTGLALLLLVQGALTGIVAGYLAQAPTDTSRSFVGAILALTLGATAVIVTGFIVWDAIFSSTPALSANTAKVLAAMFGGIIGALLGYLGISGSSRPPKRDDPTDIS